MIDFVTNEIKVSQDIVVLIWCKSHENVNDWFWKNDDCRHNELKNENDDDITFFCRRDEKVVL